MQMLFFSLVPLLIALAILGIYDIVGNKRISVKVILFFAVIFVLIFLYQINLSINSYLNATPKWELEATLISIIALFLLPMIGMGDKIFLAVTFLVYPFWLIWAIIILAQVLITPVFKVIFFFRKGAKASLPFYPFLFLATLVVYLATLYIH